MESVHAELKKFERFTDKGRKKIAEICTIAARVFSDKGYLAATLGDVANAAGMTKGGIFHYFSTKEELLYEAHLLSLNEVIENIVKINETSDPPDVKMQKAIRQHLEVFAKDFEGAFLLQQEYNLPEHYKKRDRFAERSI